MCKSKPKVLILGIYLANKDNKVRHLIEEFNTSKSFDVTQKWVALNGEPPCTLVEASTALRITEKVPKFNLINKLLLDVDLYDFDYLIVSDDDITLPKEFLDNYINLQNKYGFSLCQPARTKNSYLDHAIVKEVDNTEARQTKFVEIGPLFSVRREAFDLITPFDEEAPMGWGLDFVWPKILSSKNLIMGIIDKTPVDHSHRKPFSQYDGGAALIKMKAYLRIHDHLDPQDAFTVVKKY